MPAYAVPSEGELIELLRKTGAAKTSAKKEFRLASGAMSDHYFDLRLLCGDPVGIGAVAAALYDMIIQEETGSVGGVESGSISIAAAISHLSGQQQEARQQLPSFFVRKNRKGHGTQKMIEGVIRQPAVIVEDVITSGGSALRAVRAVRDAGYECNTLLCVVFRGTDKQRQEIEEDVNLQYLLQADQILERLGHAAAPHGGAANNMNK